MNVSALKVLMVASEAAPFAKSGGLGDVVGSLPKALKKLGVDVRVVLPKYKSIKDAYWNDVEYLGTIPVSMGGQRQDAKLLLKQGETPIYFIENSYFFGRDGFYGYGDDNARFAFFCKAVADMLVKIDFIPNIIHTNDWQSGLVNMILKESYKGFLAYSPIKTLYTIHNLQYQGNFSPDTFQMLGLPSETFGALEFYHQISYMKAGVNYADMISTVSNTYAAEMQTDSFGYGMAGALRSRQDKICGILNGIDYAENNPSTDPRIFANYDVDNLPLKKENKRQLQDKLGLEKRDVPIISMVSRLANQKGLDILAQIFEELMQEDVQFIVLGTGEERYESMFRHFASRYPGRLSANICFDDALAQQIYAGSDFFLMPSLFEPCGLGQMFALRYGTIPIVRKTGGLADTIVHYDPESKQGNGFAFEDYVGSGLLWAIKEGLKLYGQGGENWEQLVKNAMNCDFSWAHSAQDYVDLYLNMVQE